MGESMREYVAIRKLVNEGKFEEAIRKAKEIKDENEKSMTFCMVAEAMIYENRAEDAISLLNNAFELAGKMDDELAKSLAMSKISFIMAIAGNVEDAVKMACSIENDVEKVYALAKISQFLASRGEVEKAEEILNEAEKVIHEMDDLVGKVLSIKNVAYALADMGGEDKALALLKHAESIAGELNEENASAAFTLIAPVMMELGKIDDALKLSMKIKERYDKAWIISDIAYMKKDANLINEAVKIAGKMKKDMRKMIRYFKEEKFEKLQREFGVDP